MGTTSVSPSTFTGSSSFSSDFQQVITREVGFASLPIQQLQNEQTSLTSQQSELQSVTRDVQGLQSALDAINAAVGSGSYAASVSNSSIMSASVSSPSGSGSYSVTVASVGAQANTVSVNGLTTVSNPATSNIDSSSTYTLTVNGVALPTINLSSNNLNALAQAINATGANVQATVVNVGSNSTPDYRLSVQSLNYAPDTIQLTDSSGNSLLQTLSPGGSYVTYQVDGQPATPINSTSRTLNIAQGVSVNVSGIGSGIVTVSQSSANLTSALTSFANAYNTVVDEVNKSRGQNGGALAGQGVLSSLTSALNNVTSFSDGSGTSLSLSDLGLTFDTSGHLQLNSSTLTSASTSQLSAMFSFLGSETTSGFLQSANNILTDLTDSTSGLLTQENNAYTSELSGIATKISAEQDQVNTLQTNLTNQMAQADAAISQMEQQLSQITNMFTAMQQEARTISG